MKKLEVSDKSHHSPSKSNEKMTKYWELRLSKLIQESRKHLERVLINCKVGDTAHHKEEEGIYIC